MFKFLAFAVILCSHAAWAKIEKKWEKLFAGGIPYATASDGEGGLVVLSCGSNNEDTVVTRINAAGDAMWTQTHSGSCVMDKEPVNGRYDTREPVLQMTNDTIIVVPGTHILIFNKGGDLKLALPRRQSFVAGLELTPDYCQGPRQFALSIGSSLSLYNLDGSLASNFNLNQVPGRSLKLDCNHNVFITRYQLTAYSSSGQLLWSTERFDGSTWLLNLNLDGGVAVSGLIYGDNGPAVTRKYNSQGQFLWEKEEGAAGAGVWRWPLALDTDAGGNLLVTTYGYKGNFLHKYNADGTTVWTVTLPRFFGRVGQLLAHDSQRLILATDYYAEGSTEDILPQLIEVDLANNNPVVTPPVPFQQTVKIPHMAVSTQPRLVPSGNDIYMVHGPTADEKMVVIRAGML